MPRIAHALPKYRKHRGSGQAVVTINGRDFYLGPHNTRASKIECNRSGSNRKVTAPPPNPIGIHNSGFVR